MPRRFNPLTCVALGWLGLLVLAVNAGVPAPDGFGLVVVGLTLWSLGYLYYRMCQCWPIAGWLAFGFVAGLFGGGYHSHTTTVVERVDDSDCIDRDNCDGDA
jgi:hypothetical protein